MMIPCIVDKQMKSMLDQFSKDIRITEKLRPSESKWLSNGLVELFGACYYNFPGPVSEFSEVKRKAEIEEDPEYDQWMANKVHIMDTEHDGVDGHELSAGLSLLIATYNEIRKKELEGAYTFYMSSDMGSFDEHGEENSCPNCVIRFYRNYGKPVEELDAEYLNREDTAGLICFKVDPDDRQPVNAIEQIDGQWYLTYQEDES